MATNYPNSLDNFTNPTSASPINSPSHSEQHANANDAIEAIEGELGTSPKGAKATVKARLDDVDTAIATKAPIASPTFTGTVTIPSGSAITGVPYLATANTFTGNNTFASPIVGFVGTGGTYSSAAVSAYNIIHLSQGMIFINSQTGGDYNLGTNTYYNSGWKYFESSGSTLINFGNGRFNFSTAPSGTAGNAITYTSKMIIANSGTVTVNGFDAASKGLIVKAAASQTANLTEWQDSAGGLLTAINSSGQIATFGRLTVGSSVVSTDARMVLLNTGTTTSVLQIIRGIASQTADLTQWQNSAGTVLANVDASGNIYSSSTTIWTGYNRAANGAALYNFTTVAGANYAQAAITRESGFNGNLIIGQQGTGTVLVQNGSASGIGLVVKGTASQTAKLQEWQNSAGTVVASTSVEGNGYFQANLNAASIGAGNNIGGASLTASPWSAVTTVSIIRGYPSQTGDLTQWQNSSGTVVAKVNAAGNIGIGAGTTALSYGLDVFTGSARIWNGITGAGQTGTLYLGDGSLTKSYGSGWELYGALVTTGGYGISSNANLDAGGTTLGYGRLSVNTGATTTVGAVIRGVASQTANLQEWQNSAGTVLAKIDATGKLTSTVDVSINGYVIGKGAATTGTSNIAFGQLALASNTTGSGNFAIGVGVLQSNTTGNNNFALGANSLINSTTGDLNMALGSGIMYYLTTGAYNVGIGYGALSGATTGYENLSIGISSLTSTTTGFRNTAIGQGAGYLNVTGSSNVFLGYNAGYNETGSNKLYIANTNTATPLIGGDFSAKTLTVAGSTSIISQNASSSVLLVKAAASQAGSIIQWQNSSGSTIGEITNQGIFRNTYNYVQNLQGLGGGSGLYLNDVTTTAFNTNPANLVFKVQGFASQTANLQEWQNSAGTVLASVSSGGNLFAGDISVGNSSAYGVGSFGTGSNSTQQLLIANGAAGRIGLTVKGAASQTANLQEWQNSGGTIIARVSSDGSINTSGASGIYSTYGFSAAGGLSIGNGVSAIYVHSTYGMGITSASGNVTDPTLVVKLGSINQTGNLQEWQNSAGTVLSSISSSGNLSTKGLSVSSVTNTTNAGTFYNAAGTPVFNVDTSLNAINIGGGLSGVANNFASTWGYDSGLNAGYMTFTTGALGSDSLAIRRTNHVASGDYTISTLGNMRLSTASGKNFNFNNGNIGVATTAIGTNNKIIVNPYSTVDNLATVQINTNSVTNKGLVVQGIASQTANLQEWQNSAGTVLASVGPTGGLTTNSTGYSNTALSIVNNSSTVFEINQYGQSWNSTNSTFGNYYNTDGGTLPRLSVFTSGAGQKGAIIRGAASQTANLQEWQNSAGTALSYIKPDGSLYVVGNSNTAWISGPSTSGTNQISANGNDLAFSPYFDGLFAPANAAGRWRPVNDATSDLGTSGQRWKDVYATSAVLNSNSASKVGLVVKGAASQTANLQEWQNFAGYAGTAIDSSGSFYAPGIYSSYLMQATAGGAAVVPLTVKSAASQTANLQEWQNSGGTALSRVAPKGNIYVGATQTGLSGQVNGSGVVTQNTSPLFVRGTQSGQNLIELWAYGKDAFITGAVGNGTSVTYTTSIAHGFTTSDYVIINGISYSGGSGNLNIPGGNTVSAVTTYTFTVPNTSTQTYTSGGYVRNAEYPSNILQAYRSDGMSLFTIGGSGGFAMADVMSVANVGYQQAGLSIQPNLTSSAAIRMYGRSAQTAEVLDVRNYIYKSGGSDSIFAIVPDYSVSANADGYSAWVRMRNAATPTVNPTSAGYLYVGSGALNYMGTSNVPQQIVGADGSVKFTSPAAGVIPLIIQHTASPTSSYFEIRNSAGTALWGINSAGESLARTTTKYGANIQNDSNNNNTALSISAPSSGGSGVALYIYSGSTTRDIAKFDNSGTVKLTITSDGSLKGGNSSTISANTATTVDTVAISSFTTIEYTISIKQGSKVRSSKVLVHTDGTSIDSTEYGIIEMGGGITGILVTASVSSTNSILEVTITDAATTNATVKLIKTML